MDSMKFMEKISNLLSALDCKEEVKKDIFSYTASAFRINGIDCGIELGVAQDGSRKKVICACSGMVFDSLNEAARWLHSNGWPNAAASVLSRAARGVNKKAYGFIWKYV